MIQGGRIALTTAGRQLPSAPIEEPAEVIRLRDCLVDTDRAEVCRASEHRLPVHAGGTEPRLG